MGTVFLARDLKHGREVAIKVLGSGPTDAVGAQRFLSEVHTAAALNHPHILSLHDSGEDDGGTLYYVMPRVEGESLRDRLDRQERLPVPDALRIACEAAAGLAYAHAQGVVHRDIKPGNILLDRTGHVYIADFGLALALSSVSSARPTTDGMAVGSPLYMSPEQAVGQKDVDARSDVYSLGCVLFEMLAGSPPFEADGVQELLRLHIIAAPPSIRARRADIPTGLDGIIRKALAKDREDRYPTAEAFRGALEVEMGTDPGPPRAGAGRPAGRPGGDGAGAGIARHDGADAGADAGGEGELAAAFVRLRESRLVQWLAAYLAGGWLLLEATSMMVDTFAWPEALLRAALLLFALGALGVVVVAWFHGERGKQPVTLVEAVLLSVLSGVGLFAAGMIMADAWGQGGEGGSQSVEAVAAVPPDLERIAVLYLEDQSPDQSLGYMAAGITETLVGQLRSVAPLHVISANGVRPYRGTSTPIDSIARDLGVGLLVAGSLQRSGDSLRVTIELIDPSTGQALEHEVLEREMGNIFELQDDIAREVSSFLRRQVGLELQVRERREDAPNVAVWEQLQRAEELYHEARTIIASSPRSAQHLLKQADAIAARLGDEATDWAEPSLLRARIALEHIDLVITQDPEEGNRILEEAARHAAEGMDRDPGSPEALYLLGRIEAERFDYQPLSSDGGLSRAEEYLRAAVSADRGLAAAWVTLSYVLELQGEVEQAYLAAKTAFAQDPYHQDLDRTLDRLIQPLLDMGRDGEAADLCKQGRERFGATSRFLWCELVLLAQGDATTPDTARARVLYHDLVRELGGEESSQNAHWVNHAWLTRAAVHARVGDAETALRMVEEVRRRARARGMDIRHEMYVARVHLLLGEREAALASLERLIDEIPTIRPHIAGAYGFEALAGDTAFQRLVSDG